MPIATRSCNSPPLPVRTPRRVSANTPLRLGKRTYDLRGRRVSAEALSNPATVFCPACLAEDDAGAQTPALARKGRWTWGLSVVRTCPAHGLPLIRRAKVQWTDDLHELASRLPEQGPALQALIGVAATRVPSPLQAYAVARLEGCAGSDWLDAQTLEQAVRATEMLGMVLAFGPEKNLQTATQDEWDQAGRTGFAFTSRGESGIREALKEIQDACDHTATKPGPQKLFGRLYQWLAFSKSGKEPGDITRIVREYIFDNVEMPAGNKILGVELACRRLHTAGSLASETGLDSRTLRHVLAGRGLIPSDPKAGLHCAFDAEEGRAVASSMTRLVHVIALPKALSCTRPQASQLIDERILVTLADTGRDAPGRTQRAVDARQIASFLAALHAAARPAAEVPDGMVPIAKAAEKASAPSAEIVHLILGGFLSRVMRFEGEKGLAAIRIDPAEVRHVLPRVMVGLSPAEAAARLMLPVQSIWALAGAALPKDEIHCPNSRHRILRFREEDVAIFRDTYVTGTRIANDLAIERKAAAARLKAARVRPAFSQGQIGIDLYRIDDLPETCAA